MKTKLITLLLVTFFNLNLVFADGPTCSVHNHTERLKEIKSEITKYLISSAEVKRGYSYKFPKTKKVRSFIDSFIKRESKCCNFLEFRIVEGTNKLTLYIEGSKGAKNFIRNNLGNLRVIK